jgi:integrase
MDPKQVLHRYLATQRDALLANWAATAASPIRPQGSGRRIGRDSRRTPQKRRVARKDRTRRAKDAMSGRLHFHEVRAVHQAEHVAERVDD